DLLGGWVRDLRYFWFKDAMLEGIPLKVLRAGWSKQGGFELFLMDGSKGDQLWNLVKEAGKPFDIGPGYPNPSERTESGLLNWGADTDEATNPFEVRLGRFVDLDLPGDVIGVAALNRIKADGVQRHQLGIMLELPEEPEQQAAWLPIRKNGTPIGHMTHTAWSYRLKRLIGYALVSANAQPGDLVTVEKGAETVAGKLTNLPFL
ncbi:MAG: glycine cleavage T C-terminal barrel domain-containing protein, partial [Pseudomonadota bacterium]